MFYIKKTEKSVPDHLCVELIQNTYNRELFTNIPVHSLKMLCT